MKETLTIEIWQDWSGGLKKLGTVQREIGKTVLTRQASDYESRIVTETVPSIELFPGVFFVVTNLGLNRPSVTIARGQVLPPDIVIHDQ